MPRFLAQIETLSAAQFILLVAALAGTVQAIPAFLHLGSLNLATARVVQVAAVTAVAILYSIGAAFLWWFAVRRRQHSIWFTALHVTAALFAADLLTNGLGFVAASIETRGEYAIALGHSLSLAFSGPIGIALLRSPFWFVQALALIIVGRLVLHVDSLVAPSPAAATHSDPVT